MKFVTQILPLLNINVSRIQICGIWIPTVCITARFLGVVYLSNFTLNISSYTSKGLREIEGLA